MGRTREKEMLAAQSYGIKDPVSITAFMKKYHGYNLRSTDKHLVEMLKKIPHITLNDTTWVSEAKAKAVYERMYPEKTEAAQEKKNPKSDKVLDEKFQKVYDGIQEVRDIVAPLAEQLGIIPRTMETQPDKMYILEVEAPNKVLNYLHRSFGGCVDRAVAICKSGQKPGKELDEKAECLAKGLSDCKTYTDGELDVVYTIEVMEVFD